MPGKGLKRHIQHDDKSSAALMPQAVLPWEHWHMGTGRGQRKGFISGNRQGVIKGYRQGSSGVQAGVINGNRQGHPREHHLGHSGVWRNRQDQSPHLVKAAGRGRPRRGLGQRAVARIRRAGQSDDVAADYNIAFQSCSHCLSAADAT